MFMNKFIEMVKELEKLTGTNEKIGCIKKYAENDENIQKLLKLTYDPYITYGIKKVPGAVEGKNEITYDEIFALLEKLWSRELTGNKARKEIETLKESKLDNWIIDRIIGRDLKVNVSAKSINKAIKNLIPVFNIALCERIENENQIPDGYNFAQVKIDGTRNIAIVDVENETVEHYSRAGIRIKQFDNLWILKKNLITVAKKLINGKCLYKNSDKSDTKIVFDGEISGGSWAKTINAKASVNENIEAKENLIYYIFDYIPFEVWKTGQMSTETFNLIERSNNLCYSVAEFYNSIQFPHSIYHKNTNEIKDFYHECLEMGYEGIVVKKSDSYYNFKKSKDWLKLKPVLDFDGKIDDVIEGTGKYSGMLGAIVVSGQTENGQKFCTKIGSGFDEKQRKEYWNEKDKIIGKTVEFECQELTEPDENNIFSVRFPIFKCFRLDK